MMHGTPGHHSTRSLVLKQALASGPYGLRPLQPVRTRPHPRYHDWQALKIPENF